MDRARDGRSASRRRESPLWYRGGEPPVVPGRTEPVWREPALPPEPPPPERRPRSARLVALAMAGIALALVLIGVATGGEDASRAERAVRQVVIDYGHSDSPVKGCPLFSRALAQRSFGSLARCLLTDGTWRDEKLTVASVRIDGDRAFAYGTSSAGDRFRYELIREDGAWRLARLYEPDGDAREAALTWAAASGAELCELISDRLARSLYGSLAGCRSAADAVPDRLAIRAIDLTPRSLDRPTDAATVRASFGGREIRMRLRFQRTTELPEIDEVIDARSGEPIRR